MNSTNNGPAIAMQANTTPLLVAPGTTLANYAQYSTTTNPDGSVTVNGLQGVGGGVISLFGPGMQVALLGDSITRNNNFDGTTQKATINASIGYWSWASQFLGKRFASSYALNFGISGYTTSDIINNTLAAAAASASNICVVLAGTNDCAAGTSASQIFANLLKIWGALLSAGKYVVAGTIWPRSDAVLTSAQQKTLLQVNALIRKTAPTIPGVYVWDAFLYLADLTSTTAGCVSALFIDNLHPNRQGAFIAGTELANVFNTVFPRPAYPIYGVNSLSDIYDATYAPDGNLTSNATLVGTAGTNGTGASGTVATGWTVSRTTGTVLAAVNSLVAVPQVSGQVYNKQQIVLTGGITGSAVEEVAFSQIVNTSPGDSIVCGANIAVTANTGKLLYIYAKPQYQYGGFGSVQDNYYFGGATAALGSVPAIYNGATQSPPLALPAGGTTTSIQIVIGMDCSAATGSAGSATITIDRPFARKELS